MRPVVDLAPFDPEAAYAVLRALDVQDRREIEVLSGPRQPAGLLAEFMNLSAISHDMRIAWRITPGAARSPFAIVMICPHGPTGVASAGLLAKDHRRWARELSQLAIELRVAMPGFAAAHGLARIETRAWRGHPTAHSLLGAIGFRNEAELQGFGGGEAVAVQYGWVSQSIPNEERADDVHHR